MFIYERIKMIFIFSYIQSYKNQMTEHIAWRNVNNH